MPLLWVGISALGGILTGIIYEKETDTSIVQTPATPSFSWWDKALMAAAGVAAFWIWRSTK